MTSNEVFEASLFTLQLIVVSQSYSTNFVSLKRPMNWIGVQRAKKFNSIIVDLTKLAINMDCFLYVSPAKIKEPQTIEF